jgi:hypothetical protein
LVNRWTLPMTTMSPMLRLKMLQMMVTRSPLSWCSPAPRWQPTSIRRGRHPQ